VGCGSDKTAFIQPTRPNNRYPFGQQKETEDIRKIVDKHEDNLGEFSPLRPKDGEQWKCWDLDMLQDSMHNLLEEIVLQHCKTIGEQDFFERIGSRIEGVFGEGSKAEENYYF
jgi:hypothetical protein